MTEPDKDTADESPAEQLGAFLPMYWAADMCVQSLRLIVDTRDRVLCGKPSCNEDDYVDFHLEGVSNLHRLQSLVNTACWAVKGGIKLSPATRAKLTEASGKTVKTCGVLATNAHEAAITLGAYCIEAIGRTTGAISQPIDPVRLRKSITADNLLAVCRSVSQLKSDVAELAVDIRREFILIGGDASMTDFTPGWIYLPDSPSGDPMPEMPKEEPAACEKPGRVIHWRDDTYYYIFQTFFDEGQVFARLKGFTPVQAAKIWSALAVVKPRGGPGGLIRMVSFRSPHLLFPTATEFEAGVVNEAGDLVIERKRGVHIGLPIPEDDFSARIWLRKGWSRFKRRLLNKEIERDDIDCYMVRLYRLIRKLRKEVLAEPVPEPTDARVDSTMDEEPGQIITGHASGQFPSLLPASQEVRDLCRALQKELPNGRSQMVIARELTGESEGDDRKAKSLLRQARRFPHLWKKARRQRPEG
jgi:hypothetical protein